MAISSQMHLFYQFACGFTAMGLTGAVGVVSLKALKPEIFGIFPDVVVFAKAEAPTAGASSTDVDAKNIKCKLVEPSVASGTATPTGTVGAKKSDEKFDCEVSINKTTTTFTQKHVSVNSFSEPFQPPLTAGQYYKLKISKKVWNKWDSKQTQKIEVYSGDNKLANHLTPLFMMIENYMYGPTDSVGKSTKTNTLFSFVASAKKTNHETEDKDTKVKTNTIVTEITKSTKTDVDYVCEPADLWNYITPSKDCKVYDFSTPPTKTSIAEYSSLSTITFNKPAAVVDKVVDAGFYVIESPWTPRQIGNGDEDDKVLELENICPAIVADSKLFIFWPPKLVPTTKS